MTEGGDVRGWLETVCGLVLLLLVLPSADAGSGQLALTAAIAALAIMATVLVCAAREPAGRRQAAAGVAPLDASERRLHGAFRRLSSPDTPGRPRSRAPGSGPRPT